MPTEIIKASDNISRNVSQNLKQKIISGEYIDLANLVCNVQNGSSDNQTISLVQGQLIVQSKQQDIKINNIEAWTDAFLIFTSIYCSVHAAQLQDLLKYMQTMRLGAKRSFVLNWKLYDEQFQLRKTRDPISSWGGNGHRAMIILYATPN